MRIDGRAIAQNLYTELAKQVATLKQKGTTPHLAVILVGNDPASLAYVNQKKLRGEEIGINVSIHHYKEDITADELLKTIEQLNNDSNIHGIIVQQPLPAHIDANRIVEATDPRKDVDGFHKKSPFAPPIAAAVLEVLRDIAIQHEKTTENLDKWLSGKRIVVIGKGETGGKPIREEIEKRGASVSVIDSKTGNPAPLLKDADIVISCVGRPSPVNFADLKKGGILIGVGMYRGEDGKLHADYDEKITQEKAAYYTPVPGGIGPVNVAMLLKNVVIATQQT